MGMGLVTRGLDRLNSDEIVFYIAFEWIGLGMAFGFGMGYSVIFCFNSDEE